MTHPFGRSVSFRFFALPAVLACGLTFAVWAKAPAKAPAAAKVAEEPALPPEVMKEAQTIFEQRCSTCHGAGGKGDGLAAASLTPKPRDFTDATWQKSAKDADIEKIIEAGGPSIGKSALMPPNPDLAGKPVIKGLRAHIRKLGKTK